MAKKNKPSKKVSVENSSKEKENVKSNFDLKSSLNLVKHKYFKIILPIILILFVMFIAFHVRSGPINLSGMEERVEANVYANVQNIISQQVEQQYPNLNPAYKQELVAKEYQKVLDTGKFTLNGEEILVSDIAKQNAQSVKDQFQADNGQTYLNAIDPYHFLHLTQNMQETGTQGNLIKTDENGNEVSYTTYKLAPIGSKVSSKPEFHVWLESLLFKLNGLNQNSSIGEQTKAIYLIPVIFAMLSVIPCFLILRHFTNDLFGALGSLLLVSIGTFVSRTIAGFVDTDAYNVFFPLVIVVFLIYAFLYEDKIKTFGLAAVAGFFQGMFIWAWGPGWFIFVFIMTALIMYLGYITLVNIIKRSKLKEFIEPIKNNLITLFTFLISSIIFTYLFVKQNIVTLSIGNVMGAGGLTAIDSNIWPNVLSSVAELNNATFSSVISSVGGNVIFIIALLGLVLLALDFKVREEKFKIINRVVIAFAAIWFFLIVDQGYFVFLAANSQLLFLIILFLPIGLALLMRVLNHNTGDRVFLTILLSVWVAGTIYMSLNGVRFVLLLAPAFAISFGVGLYYLSNIINNFIEKEVKITHEYGKKAVGYIFMIVVFIVLFNPIYAQATNISKGTTPNFDDAWYSSMEKIRLNSSEDAIITSWWDFGHFFATVAQRGVTFDGGTQGTPRAHWVGKLLMENDEEVAHDILRMIVCGGNEAHNTMLKYSDGTTADAVKINKILYQTFGKDSEETRKVLENNSYYTYTTEQVDEIMNYLSCEEPVEDFLITSEDMVGKAGVWAHWGSWDFTKKYVFDNYKIKSADQIALDIDENVTLINGYVAELKQIEVKAKAQNVKLKDLQNQWFAPYPSYIPIQGKYQYPCQEQNSSLICQNGVIINLQTSKVTTHESMNGQLNFKNLVFPNVYGALSVIEQNSDGDIDVILIPNGDSFNVMLAQSPLGNSLFTKLFYLGGYGTKYFERFDDVQSVTGTRVITWKVKWDLNESIGDISGTQLSSVSYNATKEEAEKVAGENITLG